MNDTILEFIKSVYESPSVSADGYKTLSSKHRKIEFKKNDFLLRDREISKSYILVESGLIRKYVIDVKGNEVTTSFSSSGDFAIVVLSFFHRVPSYENVVAVTDGIGWEVSFADFMSLLKSVKGIGEWGRKWMSNQLFMSEQRSIDILVKTATERYLEILHNNPELLKQIPLKYLASYLGVTDTSLSRIRKQILGA